MAVSYGHFATFAHSLKSGAKKSFASYPAVNLANTRSYRLEARTKTPLTKQIDPQFTRKSKLTTC
ncbi:hypothetical protein M997_2714 [Proteus hauseri ATCC 700826]|uniref:Uncharacterized protein n=1 Tax=Proteus hauseri ATCC 700826 TaxID=1354271 RepID=A0AAJ3HRA1_PROHU|nr:hypothetical protein [Proteus hauseri]OAT45538.1 hypothetical protein M997_2714 [Proteus hauseri ATCC 700826]